jgi:hypothetical protein
LSFKLAPHFNSHVLGEINLSLIINGKSRNQFTLNINSTKLGENINVDNRETNNIQDENISHNFNSSINSSRNGKIQQQASCFIQPILTQKEICRSSILSKIIPKR